MRALIIFVMFNILSAVSADGPYEHDKWGTFPRDIFFKFDAYVVSFDGPDDDDGDGKPDLWGIPEFVAFEIRRVKNKHKLPKRPKWITDKELFKAGIAPDDKTYTVSGARKLPEVKTAFRFVRGHMCPKSTAERISVKAAIETHTLLNACPQLQFQNNGIWKQLEQKCEDLADKHDRIWVICGPAFFSKSPSMWLGQNGEKQAATPDALFKIIIWQTNEKLNTQAYLIPNILVKPKPLKSYKNTIQRIQSMTGLRFLTKVTNTSLYSKSPNSTRNNTKQN